MKFRELIKSTGTPKHKGFGPPKPKPLPPPPPQDRPRIAQSVRVLPQPEELPEQDELVSQRLYWQCLDLLADIRWSSKSTKLLHIIHETLETVSQSGVSDKNWIQ